MLVVGDTPRDVDAAHAAGVAALGVATGKYTVAALRAAGADYVLPALEHPLPWIADRSHPDGAPAPDTGTAPQESAANAG